MVFPIVGIAFFFLHMRETWKPILLQILGGVIIIGVAISAISNIEGLIESAWELTEEDIQEYINDDDYMFTVACWVVDQQGRWDEYDNQYDGEFAGLLTSYRGGWMEPPTRRAELVKQEIKFVEEIVSNWTQQQKREQVIAHNEFQKAEYDQEYGEVLEDILSK